MTDNISKDCMHHPWCVHIDWGDIGHDLHASSRRCPPIKRCINQDLHSSYMSCVHKASKVGLPLSDQPNRRFTKSNCIHH